MDIQEFSRQMGREEQPSRLIQALRTLSGLDVDDLRASGRVRGDWGIWPEVEPPDFADCHEPRT